MAAPRIPILVPLMMLVVFPSGTNGGEQPLQPDFSRYPVRDRFTGTPVAPDLRSAKGALEFRTVLREGARSGPNFAGQFTIVTWGCGTSCQAHAIVDAQSGRITMIPFPTAYGLEYRLDSSLLVADPSDVCLPADTIGPDSSVWFHWSGGKLERIDSVRIVEPCEDRSNKALQPTRAAQPN